MTISALIKDEIFTSESLKEAVKQNRWLFVFKSSVYDVERFAKFHPGGILVLRHLLGKDATDAIVVFHSPSIIKNQMAKYRIGTFMGEPHELESDYNEVILSRIGDVINSKGEKGNLSHSQVAINSVLNEKTFAEKKEIAESFRKLNEDIREMGFYKPNYSFYAYRFTGFALLLSTAAFILLSNPAGLFNVLISAVMFGCLWHAAAFTAHDAGHHSVTCDRKTDDLIGIFLSSFVGGLSIGWWKHNHNTHHVVTNEPENDPDIQHMPIFAVSPRFFYNLFSTYYNRVMEYDSFAKIVLPFQHFLYYPVLTFGRFNLYFLSLSYLLNFTDGERRPLRWLELSGMAFFWFWFGYGICSQIPSWPLLLLFLYVSHASTVFLHIQITLSHFAMSTEVPGYESFYEKALRTTMNVDCSPWMDWFHGGLQFQIEHHLFPRVPRCHFRKLAPLVRKFCIQHGLEYHIYTFGHGNALVLGALKEVSEHIKLLAASANPDVRYTAS